MQERDKNEGRVSLKNRLQERMLLQKLAQRRTARPTNWQRRPVVQLDKHIPNRRQKKLNYMIKIHQRIPVNPKK
jgi:hypothetical protein